MRQGPRGPRRDRHPRYRPPLPETYDTWAETESAYGIRIRAYAPERAAEEAFVRDAGINGFRHSVAARQACCGFRKVEPLGRALDGAARLAHRACGPASRPTGPTRRSPSSTRPAA